MLIDGSPLSWRVICKCPPMARESTGRTLMPPGGFGVSSRLRNRRHRSEAQVAVTFATCARAHSFFRGEWTVRHPEELLAAQSVARRLRSPLRTTRRVDGGRLIPCSPDTFTTRRRTRSCPSPHRPRPGLHKSSSNEMLHRTHPVVPVHDHRRARDAEVRRDRLVRDRGRSLRSTHPAAASGRR